MDPNASPIGTSVSVEPPAPPSPIQPVPEIPIQSPIPPQEQPVAPQPPVPPPTKKSPLVGIILGLFFLIALLAAGYFGYNYYLESNKASSQTTLPTTVPSPTAVPNPTANWKSYKSEDFGFEIKIPPSWPDEIEESSDLIRIKATDESYLEISYIQSDLELSDYIAEKDAEAATAWEGQPSKEVIKTQEGQTAGYESIRREERWLAAGFSTTVIYLKAEDKIYTFSIIPASETTAGSEVSSNIDNILTTFKFLKWSDTSKWKTWNDPNEFQIKYPSSVKVGHVNQTTNVTFTYGNREVAMAFSKIDIKTTAIDSPCIGTCTQQKQIEVTLGTETLTATQISPNNDNDFTFQIKKQYPGTTQKEYVLINVTYPSEVRLYEVNRILSTFTFSEEDK